MSESCVTASSGVSHVRSGCCCLLPNSLLLGRGPVHLLRRHSLEADLAKFLCPCFEVLATPGAWNFTTRKEQESSTARTRRYQGIKGRYPTGHTYKLSPDHAREHHHPSWAFDPANEMWGPHCSNNQQSTGRGWHRTGRIFR